MASSLFPQSTNNNPVLNAIGQLKSVAQGNPQALFENMLQSNPQFKSFADSMKGKTPEQAFSEHGLDFNQVKDLLQ